jgi:hypothetical protein
LHPNQRQWEQIGVNNLTTTDCFFVLSIPFSDNMAIKITKTFLISGGPNHFHGDNIPSSCISDTTVQNVPTKKDGTISPLQQIKAGVAAQDVACPDRYPDVIVRPDGMPYCTDERILEFLAGLWYHHTPACAPYCSIFPPIPDRD